MTLREEITNIIKTADSPYDGVVVEGIMAEVEARTAITDLKQIEELRDLTFLDNDLVCDFDRIFYSWLRDEWTIRYTSESGEGIIEFEGETLSEAITQVLETLEENTTKHKHTWLPHIIMPTHWHDELEVKSYLCECGKIWNRYSGLDKKREEKMK